MHSQHKRRHISQGLDHDWERHNLRFDSANHGPNIDARILYDVSDASLFTLATWNRDRFHKQLHHVQGGFHLPRQWRPSLL